MYTEIGQQRSITAVPRLENKKGVNSQIAVNLFLTPCKLVSEGLLQYLESQHPCSQFFHIAEGERTIIWMPAAANYYYNQGLICEKLLLLLIMAYK